MPLHVVCRGEECRSVTSVNDVSNLEVSFKIGAWKDSDSGCFSHGIFCFADHTRFKL